MMGSSEDNMMEGSEEHNHVEGIDISESEIKEYEEELKNGNHQVKISDNVFCCPNCPQKRKLDSYCPDILEHANGVGSCKSKKRSVRDEDRDEMFVWPWIGIVVNIQTEFVDGRYTAGSGSKLRDELTTKGFNPIRVIPLQNYMGHSGNALVEFNKDWSGFKNAMSFEKAYEADHHGKIDWKKGKNVEKSDLYAWVARADDYISNGIIGENLRKMGDVKTVADIIDEQDRKTQELVDALTHGIEEKKLHYKEIENKFKETLSSLGQVIMENDKLHQSYNEEFTEIVKLQSIARERIEKKFGDHEKIKFQLESQKKELNIRSKELEQREARNESERKKFLEELEKIKFQLETQKKELDIHSEELEQREARNESERKRFLEELEKIKFQLETQKKELGIRSKELKQRETRNESTWKEILQALEKIKFRSETQKKELDIRSKELKQREACNESVMKEILEALEKSVAENSSLKRRLAEEQQRQKEALHKRINQLKKDVDQKLALQLDIERFRRKAETLQKRLIEKEAKLEDQANLNQALIIKERICNDELQDARKELINGLKEFPIKSSIGIKRMGELNNKPFLEAMKKMYKNEAYAEERASIVCSLWEEYLKDPHWHPTKVITVNGKHKEVFNEDDKRLKELKSKYGNAVYEAVTTAVREINDYNPSGRYIVTELWNYDKGRRATLKEGVQYMAKHVTGKNKIIRR